MIFLEFHIKKVYFTEIILYIYIISQKHSNKKTSEYQLFIFITQQKQTNKILH